MNIFTMLKKGIRYSESKLYLFSGILLLIMMFLGAFDIIGRYVFNSPIKGALEISQILQAGIVLLTMGYVQATNSNIRIDLIRFSPRVNKILNIVILILILILFILITWQSLKAALSDLAENRLIQTIFIPTFPFKLLVPIGAVFVCLECILQLTEVVTDNERTVN